MKPKVGDQFVNEDSRIFEIIEELPDGEFRCKRYFTTNVSEFIRFKPSELAPEQHGGLWVLTSEAEESRRQFKRVEKNDPILSRKRLSDTIQLSRALSYNLLQTTNLVEEFLSDQFQKHMTGRAELDAELRKLFESITGQKLK